MVLVKGHCANTIEKVIMGASSPSLADETTGPERMYVVVEVVDYEVDQLGGKCIHGCGLVGVKHSHHFKPTFDFASVGTTDSPWYSGSIMAARLCHPFTSTRSKYLAFSSLRLSGPGS